LGFGGKACIHPDQIEIANKIFWWLKKLKFQ
jgi:citrate lyase beta subunit